MRKHLKKNKTKIKLKAKIEKAYLAGQTFGFELGMDAAWF